MNYKLRDLKMKDAALMLEWMHDENVTGQLKTNFLSFSLKDCENFIRRSKNDLNNIHKAIVDENDEYQGTVSLKNIHNGSAELAIAIRRSSMGKGASSAALKEIIAYALNEVNLKKVYWCVASNNARAIRFYDKNSYERVKELDSELIDYLHDQNNYTKEEIEQYLWYMVRK